MIKVIVIVVLVLSVIVFIKKLIEKENDEE